MTRPTRTCILRCQDVLNPGIECGLAFVLEAGHIGLGDIWLYSRVIEDSLDTLLMRSRAEAELAQLVAETERLTELHDALGSGAAAPRVTCMAPPAERADASAARTGPSQLAPPPTTIAVPTCEYTRGDALVRVEDLSLGAGVYALIGPNGSGKSTLLTLLSACARDGQLHAGVHLSPEAGCEVALSVPASSESIVEVTQRLYCPLHTAPIRWVGRGHAGEAAQLATRAAKLAIELRFTGGGADDDGDDAALAVESLAAQLLAEADDYCGGLSGGQRAKLELVRSVLMREACPPVLLLDELFAPLDSASKALVMRRLKAFCAASVVVVVYHADEEGTSTDDEVCQVGGSFFDAVLEVQKGVLLPPRKCRTLGAK